MRMGFALWVDKEMTWAQGTHEYRPMGVAIISISDYYRPRDFNGRRNTPSRDRRLFAGFFASIDHMNEYLERRRRGGGARGKHAAMDIT